MRLVIPLAISLGLSAPVQGANDVTDDAPPVGAALVGQFTTGGCVHVCESLTMCKDAYVNEKNGDCWLVLNKTHADYIGLVKHCPRPGPSFSAEKSSGNWRLTCARESAAADGEGKPESRGNKAAIPLGMQPAALEGVVGYLSDQSATAVICRKNGECIPGDGTDIEIGDTIQAPNLVLLGIEDPGGGYSKHGLTGRITDTQLVKLEDGTLALNVALSQGKMEGTIRKLTHVIRIGSVYCLAKEADYVAEATLTRGLFEIERGSGLCYEGTRKVRVDARNPRFKWEFLPASAAADGDERPDSRAVESLPDIEPF